MAELSVVFLIGLFGGAHCIGMCGGFVIALMQANGGGRTGHMHQAMYFAGKTLTYVLFGVLAGAFGAALGLAFSGFQQLLTILVGFVLVVLGLGLVGVLRRFEGLARLVPIQFLSRMIGALVRRRSPFATMGLGMLNGALPCGLVYAVLVSAAGTGSMLGGALTMGAFGLGTIPALYLVGVGGLLVRPVWRNRLSQVGGVLVILLGLATMVRGTPAMGAIMGWIHGGDAATEHCHDTGAMRH
jgi:uncharacterized protein